MTFERSLYEKKAVIQPGTEGLMCTGNEKVHPFRDLAAPFCPPPMPVAGLVVNSEGNRFVAEDSE